MRDLRRLLRYLLPHTGTFIIATFAMIVVALLEGAITALVVPIYDQALAQGGAHASATPFALQRIIPHSGLAAWRMIALLLVVFTVVKGVADYLSTYLMAYIGQSSILRLRQAFYGHLLSQSAAVFERHRPNYLVSRFVYSPAAIDAPVTYKLPDLLLHVLTLIFFLASSFYVSWVPTATS